MGALTTEVTEKELTSIAKISLLQQYFHYLK